MFWVKHTWNRQARLQVQFLFGNNPDFLSQQLPFLCSLSAFVQKRYLICTELSKHDQYYTSKTYKKLCRRLKENNYTKSETLPPILLSEHLLRVSPRGEKWRAVCSVSVPNSISKWFLLVTLVCKGKYLLHRVAPKHMWATSSDLSKQSITGDIRLNGNCTVLYSQFKGFLGGISECSK